MTLLASISQQPKQRLRAGRGMTLTDVAFGQSLAARPSDKWKHPWTVTPGWSVKATQWVATIKPGFVNEQCPIWRTRVTEQKEAEGRDFGINPLTGKPFFSADVFSQSSTTDAQPDREIDVPLYLDPAIPLSFRNVGFDGSPQFPVPAFFKQRGVADAPKQPAPDDVDALAESLTSEPATFNPTARLLRACDLWVHQPRLALTSETIFGAGLATGISNAQQVLGLRSAAPGDTLRVFSGTFRPIGQTAGIDALAGIYEEPNFDELLIATVYLLSPPGTQPGAEPDGTWQPYVRHNLFWNLQHVVPWFRPQAGDPTTSLIPPLAGGAAQLVINFLTSSLNDILQQARNLVNAHSMAGTFYTATGGGHSALMPDPETIPTAGLGGLDKKARIKATAAAKARVKAAQTLDPAFPFRAEPFAAELLT